MAAAGGDFGDVGFGFFELGRDGLLGARVGQFQGVAGLAGLEGGGLAFLLLDEGQGAPLGQGHGVGFDAAGFLEVHLLEAEGGGAGLLGEGGELVQHGLLAAAQGDGGDGGAQLGEVLAAEDLGSGALLMVVQVEAPEGAQQLGVHEKDIVREN